MLLSGNIHNLCFERKRLFGRIFIGLQKIIFPFLLIVTKEAGSFVKTFPAPLLHNL
nr:MAG TPA: hypothetical protein [Caudoviricetes sp.]